MKSLLTILLALTLCVPAVIAADVTRAQQAGRDLTAVILSQKPNQNLTTSGVFTTRNSAGRRHQIPFRFSVITGETNWQSVYEVLNTNQSVVERLTIIHAEALPN